MHRCHQTQSGLGCCAAFPVIPLSLRQCLRTCCSRQHCATARTRRASWKVACASYAAAVTACNMPVWTRHHIPVPWGGAALMPATSQRGRRASGAIREKAEARHLRNKSLRARTEHQRRKHFVPDAHEHFVFVHGRAGAGNCNAQAELVDKSPMHHEVHNNENRCHLPYMDTTANMPAVSPHPPPSR